jgi:hypothetical protein
MTRVTRREVAASLNIYIIRLEMNAEGSRTFPKLAPCEKRVGSAAIGVGVDAFRLLGSTRKIVKR